MKLIQAGTTVALIVAQDTTTSPPRGLPLGPMMERRLQRRDAIINFLVPDQPGYNQPYKLYGCWCMPGQGSGLRTPNHGHPIDKIDAACKRAHMCYSCAQMDRPEIQCRLKKTSYSYSLHQDDSDPSNLFKRDIICNDDPNIDSRSGCKRSICECERQLAIDLRDASSDWIPEHHTSHP